MRTIMWDFSNNKTYTFRQFSIPSYMMPGLQRYIEEHIAPGDFLKAVICNDLKKAVELADDENLANLAAYVGFLYNETPGPCWGSPEKYKKWLSNES